MSSQRKQIRQAVVELLKGKTDCAERVYPNRVRNSFEIELPSIMVYTKAEAVRIFTAAPREYEKDLHLVIEIVVKADEDLDDLIDDITDDIEYWMHQDHTKGEICADTTLLSTEIAIVPNGDTLIGSAILTYSMVYYTEAVRDSKDLRVLARADIKYNLLSDDPAASGIEAEDLINPVTGDA